MNGVRMEAKAGRWSTACTGWRDHDEPIKQGSTIPTVVQVHAALSADEMRRWSGSHSLAHASPPHPWLQSSEESGEGGAG